MHNITPRFWQSFFSILVCSCCCIEAVQAQDQIDKSSTVGIQITNLLAAQTRAWNDGDLEKFMETYWKSDKLTFSSGGKTTYGWEATLANYRKSYAPPNDMGKLKFDHLEIMNIESNSALVLGQWHLQMKDLTKRDGNFSLVVRKLKSGWKIIHDHSSTLEPEPDPNTPEPEK